MHALQQQLAATEQQLATSEQQLAASEQQLAATEQQLAATAAENQVLREVNGEAESKIEHLESELQQQQESANTLEVCFSFYHTGA